MITNSNVLRIPLTELTVFEKRRLEDFFKVTIETADGDKYAYHYGIDSNYMYLPKYTNLKDIIGSDRIKNTIVNKPFNKENEGLFNDVVHNIELRNEKQITTVEFMDKNRDKDIMVSLSTGSGKTILTIRYFLVNNLKPMILCHNLSIMNQWVDKCVALGIDRNDIGILQGSFSKRKNSNKKVYIASIATINNMLDRPDDRKFLMNIKNEEFLDLLIVDESHKHFSAVSKVLFNLDVPQKILLTATVKRSLREESDLIPHVFPMENCINIVEYEQDIDVVFMKFDSNIQHNELYYVSIMDKYKFDNNRYVKYMMKKPENSYFRLVDYARRKMLSKLVENAKNKTIISGSTLAQLEFLYEQFTTMYPDLKIKRFYGAHKKKTENIPVTGDDSDVILCVGRSIDAGFDLEDLTLLINLEYIKSESYVIQFKGRLARSYEGKVKAISLNLMDMAIPHLVSNRYNDIIGIIEREGKSKLSHFDSGIVLPLNPQKKKK